METVTKGILTRDEMERRRLQAAQDLQKGMPQSQVARKFGVSRNTACRWWQVLQDNGIEGLRKRPTPGRPSRLKPDQQQVLAEIYQAGPRAAGFDSDKWTTAKFADAVFNRLAIRYDRDHLGRIIHRLGLWDKNRHRRYQRDAVAA